MGVRRAHVDESDIDFIQQTTFRRVLDCVTGYSARLLQTFEVTGPGFQLPWLKFTSYRCQ